MHTNKKISSPAHRSISTDLYSWSLLQKDQLTFIIFISNKNYHIYHHSDLPRPALLHHSPVLPSPISHLRSPNLLDKVSISSIRKKRKTERHVRKNGRIQEDQREPSVVEQLVSCTREHQYQVPWLHTAWHKTRTQFQNNGGLTFCSHR